MIRSEAIATVFALGLLCASASAEPTTVQKSTADALFKEGKKAMDAKDWESACPKLAESHRLQPGGGVVLALALCHEQQQRFASALTEYKEAAFLARRDKRKDREGAATQKVAELEAKVSHLTVRIGEAARAQNVEVELDGSALAPTSIGIALPVDGGKHALVVKAPGRVSRTVDLVIANEKDKREVTVEPLDAEVKPAEPTKVATPVEQPAPILEHSSRRTIGLVVSGASLVVIGIGTYFGLHARSLHGDVKSGCPELRCSDPGLVDRNEDAKKAASISTIAFVVGGISLAAGIVVFATAPPSETQKSAAVRSSLALGLGSATWKLVW